MLNGKEILLMLNVQTPSEPDDPGRPMRSRFSALVKITALAALGNALAHFLHLLLALVIGQIFIPPLLILGLFMLAAAGIALLRWRFAPALTALLILLANGVELSIPINQYSVTHPSEGLFFIIHVLMLACALVAIVAGTGAAIQHARHLEQPDPRTVRTVLTAFTAFVAGMLVVSLLATANPAASSASTTTNGMPTVHLSRVTFVQNVVLVPKGSKLLLVDDGNYDHVFANGSWQNNTPVAQSEPGAPVVQNVSIGGGSLVIGPFTTAGVYHLYCTIHVGMNLTIVVQ